MNSALRRILMLTVFALTVNASCLLAAESTQETQGGASGMSVKAQPATEATAEVQAKAAEETAKRAAINLDSAEKKAKDVVKKQAAVKKTVVKKAAVKKTAAAQKKVAAVKVKPVKKKLEIIPWKEARYPVYIAEPEGFKKSEVPQGIVVISGEPEKTAEAWKDAADTANLLMVSANFEVLDKDVSEKADQWLLSLKRQIGLQYQTRGFYLIGEGTKAHYASYLGLKYPEEFAGVAAIGHSWVGPFEQLVKYSSNEKKQTAFFIAMHHDNADLEGTKIRAQQMQEKGYKVQLIILEKQGEENSANLKADALVWLRANASAAKAGQPQAITALSSVSAGDEKKVSEVKQGVNVAAAPSAAPTPTPAPVKKSKWKAKASEIIDDFFAL